MTTLLRQPLATILHRLGEKGFMPEEIFNGMIGGIFGSVMGLQFAFNLFNRFKISKPAFLALVADRDVPVLRKRYFFKWYAFTVLDGMKVFCRMDGEADPDFSRTVPCLR